MKIAKWISFGAAILSGVIFLVSYCVPLVIGWSSFGDNNSIGIIGGADGPTAVFLTKSSARIFVMPFISVVSLFAWLFFRWKSKKSG